MMQTVDSGFPLGIEKSSIVKVYMLCEDLFRQKVYLEDQVTLIEVHSNIEESKFTEYFEKMKKKAALGNEMIRVSDAVILYDYFIKGRTYDKENEADVEIYETMCKQIYAKGGLSHSDTRQYSYMMAEIAAKIYAKDLQ